jgi:hypothetical protein
MIRELIRAFWMIQMISWIIFLFKNIDTKDKLLNLIQELNEFLIYIGNNNPLLCIYYDEDDNINLIDNGVNDNTVNDVNDNTVNDNNNTVNDNTVNDVINEYKKYETKYIEKFKKFSTEVVFTAEELEQKQIECNKIRIAFETEKEDKICSIKKELLKIDVALNELNQINEDEDYEDEEDKYELISELQSEQANLMKELETVETNVLTDEEIEIKVRDIVVNKRLDTYINNYILEHTPLGNVIMRYNNDKKSFEYFSNNTIPYRYLEPIGRKYVMTYWCKYIFVDIEEELKKAEEKYDEEQEKKVKENEKKLSNKEKKVSFKTQFKSYNIESKDTKTMPMKNRSDKNVLPPQIKANLPDVNKQSSEKMLLKENANRYTWEGRISNFVPLKKIDKKIMNKQLAMTYAEFKKMQEEKRNI